jgi:hypothetical protein
MGVYTGQNAKLAFGTNTISDMVDYTFSIDADLLEEPVFGDGWSTVAGQGVKGAGGSMSGLVNTADTNGQVVLENAVISGTKITDFRLYVNDTEYWTSNTGADADAGVYFSSYEITGAANDIIRFSCDFRFHGQVWKTS